MKSFLACGLLWLAAPSAWSQPNEISILGGFTSSASIENKANQIQDLNLASGLTLGGAVTRFFSPHWGAEVSFVHQQSAIRLTTSTDEADLFDVGIGQLQASFVYQFGADGSRIRPFLSGGLGAAFLSSAYLDGETKLAWSLGAGIRWFPWKQTGLRLHARYKPIRLNDASSDYCDPFGFCQDGLKQFEVMGGVAFRF